jgi:outer membrane protein TolC
MLRFNVPLLVAVLSLPALPVLAAPPLALDEALARAERASPQLAAQRAAADSAAAMVGPAGQNPDPKLIVGLENVPVQGGDRWSLTGDSMTMRRIGVMQDFVRREKLDLREARAAAEARREQAMVSMQLADLRREVATAWFERYYAERARELATQLAREAEVQASTAASGIATGRTASPEAVAARGLQLSLEDRLLDIDRQARRAEAQLSRWIEGDATRPPAAPPDVFTLPLQREADGELASHPHIAIYEPMREAAEAEARLARVATKPDWNVELSYGQRGSAYDNMVSLMVRVDLPLFASRRQDPLAVARERAVDQVRAQAEDATRRHVAEIRAASADWEIAKARVERYRRDIVPLAEERQRLATAAYQGARADLATVFEARRNVFEQKLAAVNAEADVARAWAQLAFLVPGRSQP